MSLAILDTKSQQNLISLSLAKQFGLVITPSHLFIIPIGLDLEGKEEVDKDAEHPKICQSGRFFLTIYCVK